MKDPFDQGKDQPSFHVNIYADEVVDKKCPYTGHLWHYIGIIIEDLARPLFDDIIYKRFRGNFSLFFFLHKITNAI